MKHKLSARLISMLLVIATLVGLLVPASAASLSGSGSVKITQAGFGNYLNKKSGGTIGGGYWTYTSNDGLTGSAYCINWGLTGVSPSKSLTIQEYSRSPQTMGAFVNGYPNRTLAQFKELHPSDVRGIAQLTEDEYKYATQVAVWATCGQIAVPGTSFTAGSTSVVEPTSDARQIRVFDSVKAILALSAHWVKHLYPGLSIRSEEDQDLRAVEVIHNDGLEGAASVNQDGIKKENINGKEYYTRVMYVSSATSTWIDGYTTKVYSTDAPAGTIFVAENNSPLETVQENGATCYKVSTQKNRSTSLNSNGEEYYGTFKVCIPVDNVADEGSFTIKASGGAAQFNLYLANNPSATEQSYIISDPGYTTLEASAPFKWSKTGTEDGSASLQIVKTGPGGGPLEGAEFTLTGDKGTTVTGTSDRNGQVIWTDLPADEKFTLTETTAPEGCQPIAPMNITLTAGHTNYVTVPNEAEKGFTVKKVDAQNKASLQGAVFRFEQIDGSYVTTGITGFDGMISFEGDELPYGSYRVTEESAPEGYLKDTRVETVEWTGEKDVLLTFEDVREMRLIILKKDQNGISLEGAVFDIYGDGKYLTSVTTNQAGEAYVTGIKAEMYIEAIEKAAPEGYVLDRTSHSVHIDPYNPAIEDDPVLTIVNQSKPSLRIIKYDRVSGAGLSGVTFEIYKDAELFDTKTTPENGIIELFDLDPGTYLVKEVSSDDAHIVTTTPQQIELKAGQTATQELVFFNDLKPGMHLIKVDSADLSKPIANAKFKFTAVDGSWGPEELTTGVDGTIDLSKLPTGAYVVEELECPGYVIDDFQRIIELKPNETAQFVFTNSKLPSLLLTKTSSDGSPLEGVSFRLAKIEDGSRYLDRTTDSKGEILWEGLEPGVYSLKETATVNDHILDLREYHVELFPGKTSTIVLENHKRPNLIVYKNDADTGEPVEHTIFTVRAADGHSVDEIETDSTGRAVLENLLPGVYEITEKSVPSPYLPDAPSQLVTLYPDRDHTAYFKNHKRPIIEIVKENAVTYERLANVPFRVWYASNNTTTGEFNDLGVFYTDENGRIELDGTKMGTLGLRDGWFRVQELEPLKGFAKADPDTQEAFIPAGQGHTFVFRNQPLSAICVWKYDSEHPNVAIEGAVFQIRYLSGNTSGTGGTVIGTFRTSANGSFTATGLAKGTYIVEELSSDGSHVIDTPPQTVYLSGEEQEVIHVYFSNSPMGSLLVKKVDANDGSPLSDVEFFVTTSDGTVVGDANGKFVTDSAGTFTVSGIEPGKTLIVKETRQKTGYILDDVPQTAKISAGQTVTLEFRNKKQGNLIIYKLSSVDKSPLEGAQFKITYANGQVVDSADGKLSSNGLYTTNAEGQIILSNVTGTIICTEVASPEGYAIDPNTRSQTVVVNPGDDTQSLYFYNNPLCSLTISKVDSLTGKPIPNTTFTVKYASGELIGRYTTGQDGTVTVSGLLPGSTVVVTEYKVPDTHVLNTTPQTITLKSGANTVTSGSGTNAGTTPGGNTGTGGNNLDFENDPKMTLTIRKYIKGTDYEPLKGVCFKVVDGYGKPIGTNNGVYYTNSAGEIVLEDLEPGTTVTAREISTVEGFVLDGEPQTITIQASKKPQELIFWNEKAGSLVIQKKSSLDGSPLAGVQFLLTYADGSYVDANNGHTSSKGLYETDAAGEIRISGITGTVIVKELKTLSGYTIDPATCTQTVQINPDDCQTLVFYNTPIGNFELIKVVEGNESKRIPNVTFEIRRVSDGGLVDTITTGSDGRATLQLDAGNYYAVETKCPSEYKLDSTPHYFTMKDDGKGTTLTVSNEAFSGIILHKINSVTKEGIYGVKFLVYDQNKNPIGEYTTDDQGYIYIDDLTVQGKGRLYIRELEAAQGYELDKEYKTVYVQPGKTIEIEWENVPITGQFQIYKYAAEYNEVTGTAAGAPVKGAVYEISEARSGKVVDYITTDARGVAASKPLPLGRYKIVEVTAPAYWQLSGTIFDETLEYSGQIIKLSDYDKPSNLGVTITKRGNAEVLAGSQMRYDITVANTSNVALENFYWHDRIPTDATRATVLTTGTYSARLNYRVLYKTNYTTAYQVLASNLLTTSSYSFSLNAIPMQAGEYVTDVYFDFGKVPVGFQSTANPTLTVQVLGSIANGYQIMNRADVGGKYQGTWQTAQATWLTIVRKLTPTYVPTLPKTGY